MTGERDRLIGELEAVQSLLQAGLTDLYSPLNELAQAQLQQAYPLRRAMLVLTTGVYLDDMESLRQQRLYLAAALEMLNVALEIHQLLLSANRPEDNPNQRSIDGGVILTGDYCFTQSAILAAKTDHIQVVELFSETLKQVSEGILRQLFAKRDAATLRKEGKSQRDVAAFSFDSELALCEAGIKGASILAQTSTEIQTALEAMVHTVVPLWQQDIHGAASATLPLSQLTPIQQERWRAFQHWLGTDE